MRIAVIAVALLIALASGSVPRGFAKDDEAATARPPSAWTFAPMVPLVDAEEAWRKNRVQIRRIRLFDRALILTLRAHTPSDVTSALETLVKSPVLEERTTLPGHLLSIAAADVDARPYEVDVLVNAHHLKPDPPMWDGTPSHDAKAATAHLDKLVERSSRMVNMKPRKRWKSSRSIDGRPFQALVVAYEAGSAEQFLKLLHNVMRFGGATFLVSARWDARPEGAKPEAPAGPCLIELVDAVMKTSAAK